MAPAQAHDGTPPQVKSACRRINNLPVSPATFAELWAEAGITLRVGNLMYSCPWHGADVHPSLRIDSAKQKWLCFACNRHGGYRMLWREVRPGFQIPGGEGQLSDEDRAVLDRCDALAQDISLFQTHQTIGPIWPPLEQPGSKGSLELGVPGRWLAEEAGFHERTSRAVLKRLVAGGRIERCEVPGTTAGGYRVLDPLNRTLNETPQSYDTGGAVRASVSHMPYRKGMDALTPHPLPDGLPIGHDAIRHGGLGAAYKTATHLMHHTKDTVPGIQKALGYKSPRSIYTHLKKLITAQLVIKDGDLYRWVEPDQQSLDEYAQLCGVAGKGEAAKRQHQHDRETYQAHQDYLAQKMTTSRQRRAQRRLEAELDQCTIPANLDPYSRLLVNNTTGELIDSTEPVEHTP